MFLEMTNEGTHQQLHERNLTMTGPRSPSRPTVKRLFAVSGNCCAFPNCRTSLVDPNSGSIVGEICHIKGDKPNSARYDSSQSEEQRHGFDNLILLCGSHHKIVDDSELDYTVDRLVKMKVEHETRNSTGRPRIDDQAVERFITSALGTLVLHRSVINSVGQTGGQIAHTIHNYGAANLFCVATHTGTYESVDVSSCQWFGRPSRPNWLDVSPQRMCSNWLVERFRRNANLQLYFAPNWAGGTYFIVDKQERDGEVINLQQLEDLKPTSPTTTSTTTQAPESSGFNNGDWGKNG